MTPDRLLNFGIVPACVELAKMGVPDSVDARRFLLAIALQESGLMHRRQVLVDGSEAGPAASFWQFEQVGCRGVLSHPSSGDKMRRLCVAYNVNPTPGGLWEAMRYNDVIAAAAARLLVFTLPASLPTTSGAGWSQYIDAWRPGRPRANSWESAWDLASLVAGVPP